MKEHKASGREFKEALKQQLSDNGIDPRKEILIRTPLPRDTIHAVLVGDKRVCIHFRQYYRTNTLIPKISAAAIPKKLLKRKPASETYRTEEGYWAHCIKLFDNVERHGERGLHLCKYRETSPCVYLGATTSHHGDTLRYILGITPQMAGRGHPYNLPKGSPPLISLIRWAHMFKRRAKAGYCPDYSGRFTQWALQQTME